MNKNTISRRNFISGTGCSSLAPMLQTSRRPKGAARKHPNLLFIYTDDQRWDAVRAFGRQPWLKTPNLDRLVREGAVFRNSFVNISLCAPSRSSILTGLYPHKTGVVDNQRSSRMRDDVRVVASLLREGGYTTAYIGKVHIPNFWEKDRGFDYVASFSGQGVYFNNKFLINGKETATEGYITDRINAFALDFLKQRDPARPFALFIGHKAVHQPFEPDPKYKGLFDNEWFELPKTWDDTYEGRPSYLKVRRKSVLGLDGMLQKNFYTGMQRKIATCLVSVDDGVGQILGFLGKTGELDDTVLIYSSDNGYFRGEHGLHDKRAMYEDSIRVPLLVHYPRLVQGGRTFDQMVLNLDVSPTLLDLAGVDIPQHMQGKSWKSILEGKDPRGRDHWLYEYFWEKQYPTEPTQYGIRTRRYKYIRFPDVKNADPDYPMSADLPYDQLYDLQNDPLEMLNLAGKPGAAPLLARMKDLLKRALEETEYPGRFA